MRRKGVGTKSVAAILAMVIILVFAVAVAFLAAPKIQPSTATIARSLSSSSSSPSSQTSRRTSAVGANASTLAPSGLRLSTFINATDLTVGENLNISISLFNTLSTANSFWPQQSFSHSQSGEEGNWTFHGIPVATWVECSHEFDFDWPMPIEVVVLSGNYTAQELPSNVNMTTPYTCGITSPSIPTYTFEPNSDLINATGFFDGGAGTRPIGQFRLSSNFTMSGYWSVTSLASGDPSICEPAVSNRCAPPPLIPFVPGVYTVGVSDELGQFNVLHFQVTLGPS
jgi:hypothetical protein